MSDLMSSYSTEIPDQLSFQLGRRLGYARVSSKDQNLARQLAALAHCDRIFQEKRSGKNVAREQLQAMLDYARPGDIIEVTEMSRLSRKVLDLLQIINGLNERGIQLVFQKERIDTTTSIGRFFFVILAAVGEVHREMILENAAEGRAAARARGETGGRPAKPAELYASAQKLVNTGMGMREAAKIVGVHHTTLARHGIVRQLVEVVG